MYIVSTEPFERIPGCLSYSNNASLQGLVKVNSNCTHPHSCKHVDVIVHVYFAHQCYNVQFSVKSSDKPTRWVSKPCGLERINLFITLKERHKYWFVYYNSFDKVFVCKDKQRASPSCGKNYHFKWKCHFLTTVHILVFVASPPLTSRSYRDSCTWDGWCECLV